MNYIKKITFANDLEVEINPYSWIEIHDENFWERNKRKLKYENQFKDFNGTILENIVQNHVKDYAINELELIAEKEFECEEITIKDFSNNELVNELRLRNLGNFTNTNIIQDDIVSRFLKNINKIDLTEIEVLLKKYEL